MGIQWTFGANFQCDECGRMIEQVGERHQRKVLRWARNLGWQIDQGEDPALVRCPAHALSDAGDGPPKLR